MIEYMKKLENGYIPNVLLLGNGINRAFNSVEWDGLLRDMSKKVEFTEEEWSTIKKLPYPLMAVAATDDHLKTGMKTQAESMVNMSVSDEQIDILKNIAACDFDAILTTNYTYEIEKALNKSFSVKSGQSSKFRFKTCKDKSVNETSMLYQYIKSDYKNNDISIPVWHIHGEAGRPSSMIIGHYYYGKLLATVEKYVGEMVKRYNIAERNSDGYYPRSWVDYFMYGNVYIVGQGLDGSEMDLWWLINCKKRNGRGKVYFYEPELSEEKRILAKAYNVEHIDIGLKAIERVEDENKGPKDYKEYYGRVFESIKKKSLQKT